MRNEISIIIVGFEFINSVWISDIYRFSHHRRTYPSVYSVSTVWFRLSVMSVQFIFSDFFTTMTTRPQRSQTDTGQTSQTRYRYDTRIDSTGNK